jgi:hypothetical protein
MSSPRIVVDATKPASKLMLQAVSTFNDALAQLRRVKAQQDMMMNGDAAGVQAAAEYGLGLAADGATVCNLVGTALAAIDVAQTAALSKLDQG